MPYNLCFNKPSKWELGGRFKSERTYVYLRLIIVDVWLPGGTVVKNPNVNAGDALGQEDP